MLSGSEQARQRSFLFFLLRLPLSSTLFPYTTLFRSSSITRGSGIICKTGTRITAQLPAWGRWPRSTAPAGRSEEHTSELQSHSDLVCRLLLEKKKHTRSTHRISNRARHHMQLRVHGA